MSLTHLVMRSLRYYWRSGLVVAFGLAVATAVITASLIVGDSVRGSLRDRAISGLGRIDHALVAPYSFRETLAADLARNPAVVQHVAGVMPLIITKGSARNANTGDTVPDASILGIGARFWKLYPSGQPVAVTGRQVAINAALARDLSLHVGDGLILRMDRLGSLPSDALFARRRPQDTQSAVRVQITAILPDVGSGGFKLSASSEMPRNVFVDREWLASAMQHDGTANALVTWGGKPAPPGDDPVLKALQRAMIMACSLDDYGMSLERSPGAGELCLKSESMVLTDKAVSAASTAAAACGGQALPTSVYLATTVQDATRSTSTAYSLLAGIDSSRPLHFASGGGKSLKPGEAWINQWAADDLHAGVGDTLHISYFVPDWSGDFSSGQASFVVRGIVTMDSASTDPSLAPTLKGITDTDSIDEWDAPFPIKRSRITQRDEQYWRLYRATPRLFVPLSAAHAMWASSPAACSGGWITSVRILPAPGTPPVSPARFENRFRRELSLRLGPEDAGLFFRPVRQLALDEAQGTTDFASLFLSMSIFLVIAAAGLAGTLTRLAAERRAAQAGLMLATGFTSAAASRVVLAEGMLLALAGAIMGAPLGILYAWGIVHGMDRWWIQSLGTSVLWLHLSLSSLITGAVSGLIIGALTVGWATRVYGRYRVLDLLSGWQSLATLPSGRSTRTAGVIALALLVIAVGLAVAAATTGAVPPGEACFMSGAALLGASLAGCYAMLAGLWQAAGRSLTMPGLAMRSAAANRGRSMLVVGLLASSCFIMVAVSANTRDFSHFDTHLKDSGTGGFTLRATSSMPIRFDFGAPAGRSALGFRPSDEPIFKGVQVFPFLASTGEDISCLNLARPTAPRVLGVSPAMIQRGGFTVLTESGAPANPWQLLDGGPARDGAIPAMGDADSITWTLHSALGEVYPTPTGAGKIARLRFVGMLSRSIIAGELLISEANFRVDFPEVASPRYFLIVTPPGKAAAVASALRRNLGDMGLQVQTTREVLNTYGAVQNTYISMFLALGGLGLLMGTIGMVAVILRNALDRRREWALMLATGFTRQDLARLLIMENAALLAIGIVCGTLSALVAVAPQLTLVESHVSWPGVVGLLAGTALVGLISCIASARTAVAGALVQALQEEA